jgi:hypothetical protein
MNAQTDSRDQRLDNGSKEMPTGRLQLDRFNIWRRISSWNELVQCEDDLDSLKNEWVFRGLCDSDLGTLRQSCCGEVR